MYLVQDNNQIIPRLRKTNSIYDNRFACHSYGTTQWLFQDDYLPDNAIMTGYNGEILLIIKTSIHNSGRYQCYGTYRNKTMHFISKARLFVYGKFIERKIEKEIFHIRLL